MALLKCDRCNNLVTSPPANMGDPCNKEGCWGHMGFYANTMVVPPKELRLQCKTCGNVYKASPTRKIFDKCNVGGCTGTLDRYWR
jgi:hypothetical protein